mgnify:CR=1 FL=1
MYRGTSLKNLKYHNKENPNETNLYSDPCPFSAGPHRLLRRRTGETDSLTPEERTQRFVTAITDARSEEDNEYNSILSSADDDTADMTSSS